MKPFLKSAWEKRNKLWVEGLKLYAEGEKLRAEGEKLRAEGYKLRVEGNKLYVKRTLDYYDNKAIIDWDTGEVEGEILAIPAGELKVK